MQPETLQPSHAQPVDEALLQDIVRKIVERFHPQAIYGNPARRQIFMVVNLDTPAQMAELMYVLTWFTSNDPTFTPVMGPEIYADAIANAKRVLPPPT